MGPVVMGALGLHEVAGLRDDVGDVPVAGVEVREGGL
jgi:hypothetical protein